MGQDRVGPSSKIWASRNNSGLGRINGSSLARAVGVYGRLRDLREPEVPGRASDGATTATDVVLEGEHQSGRAVCVDACESLFSIAPEPGDNDFFFAINVVSYSLLYFFSLLRCLSQKNLQRGKPLLGSGRGAGGANRWALPAPGE